MKELLCFVLTWIASDEQFAPVYLADTASAIGVRSRALALFALSAYRALGGICAPKRTEEEAIDVLAAGITVEIYGHDFKASCNSSYAVLSDVIGDMAWIAEHYGVMHYAISIDLTRPCR